MTLMVFHLLTSSGRLLLGHGSSFFPPLHCGQKRLTCWELCLSWLLLLGHSFFLISLSLILILSLFKRNENYISYVLISSYFFFSFIYMYIGPDKNSQEKKIAVVSYTF